jgi:hypothetical protein
VINIQYTNIKQNNFPLKIEAMIMQVVVTFVLMKKWLLEDIVLGVLSALAT